MADIQCLEWKRNVLNPTTLSSTKLCRTSSNVNHESKSFTSLQSTLLAMGWQSSSAPSLPQTDDEMKHHKQVITTLRPSVLCAAGDSLICPKCATNLEWTGSEHQQTGGIYMSRVSRPPQPRSRCLQTLKIEEDKFFWLKACHRIHFSFDRETARQRIHVMKLYEGSRAWLNLENSIFTIPYHTAHHQVSEAFTIVWEQ